MSYYDSYPCSRQAYDQMAPAFNVPSGATGMPLYPLPAISPEGYPTGMPLGPAYSQPAVQQLPSLVSTPTVPSAAAVPSGGAIPAQTLVNPQYTAGFLRTQIGRSMRVDFLIGSNNITDRSGTLVGVGASYILLRQESTGEIIMCDLYSIKFVTIFPLGTAVIPSPSRTSES
ncbi:MAG: hypothetical protein QHH06_15160 [Clostridiales bacterium]|jgi:hypothetical protein|nr:hypothetical protein [Eubacteriales bacterium]MDH7567773.1 hypothetical protein [Clostridiales bacterium]